MTKTTRTRALLAIAALCFSTATGQHAIAVGIRFSITLAHSAFGTDAAADLFRFIH